MRVSTSAATAAHVRWRRRGCRAAPRINKGGAPPVARRLPLQQVPLHSVSVAPPEPARDTMCLAAQLPPTRSAGHWGVFRGAPGKGLPGRPG